MHNVGDKRGQRATLSPTSLYTNTNLPPPASPTMQSPSHHRPPQTSHDTVLHELSYPTALLPRSGPADLGPNVCPVPNSISANADLCTSASSRRWRGDMIGIDIAGGSAASAAETAGGGEAAVPGTTSCTCQVYGTAGSTIFPSLSSAVGRRERLFWRGGEGGLEEDVRGCKGEGNEGERLYAFFGASTPTLL